MSYADLGSYGACATGIYWPQQSVLITAPTVEPVSLTTAKLAARIDHTDDDALIAIFITTARRRFEGYLGRALSAQTREVRLNRFYDAIRLPYPVHYAGAVTSVTYLDATGASTVLSSGAYRLTDVESDLGAVLRPIYNTEWPSTLDDVEAVRIRYTCGYSVTGSTVNAPAEVSAAICGFVAHLYANRESVSDVEMFEVPDHCWSLLGGLKARWF